eukprot:c4761_g1_i2.p2 GENE.c4761_g1_i2~~c4761_g1_i2.p2  ORF type:complete len:151 (+),score=22.63 c4761_g1_i2:588-1040(+)
MNSQMYTLMWWTQVLSSSLCGSSFLFFIARTAAIFDDENRISAPPHDCSTRSSVCSTDPVTCTVPNVQQLSSIPVWATAAAKASTNNDGSRDAKTFEGPANSKVGLFEIWKRQGLSDDKVMNLLSHIADSDGQKIQLFQEYKRVQLVIHQ